MLLPYDVLNRLVCKLLAIGSQAADVGTNEAKCSGGWSWMCCFPNPCSMSRMMLQLMNWFLLSLVSKDEDDDDDDEKDETADGNPVPQSMEPGDCMS